MKTNGITTLQTIVYEVMNDLGKTQMHDFKRYLQWAIRGYKKLNMFHLNTVETFTSSVSEINTVNLPDDFINYTRIGYVKGNVIYTLSRNDDLLLTFSTVDGNEVVGESMKDNQNILNAVWLAAPQQVFNIGFYRLDRANNRIVLQGNLSDFTIVVEYISSGISLNGQTYIPEIAREALIAYLHWQRVLNGEGTLNEAMYRERLFTDAVDDIENFEWSCTPEEFLDVINSARTQLPS
jgi:hypothetical protein